MLRLVLDTSIIVSAFRSRTGASRQLFVHFAREEFVLLASEALFLEYEAVLKRPEQVLIHGRSPEAVTKYLEYLARFIEPVRVRFKWRPQLRDPDDEMVLEAAINGYADAIVTHNVRDFYPAAEEFGLKVYTPGRIIKEGFEK